MPHIAAKLLRLTLAILAVLVVVQPLPAHALGTKILRVAENGLKDPTCGLSWDRPCDLTYALDILSVPYLGDSFELWVKAGTYYPETTQPLPQLAYFRLKNGVALYGGFAGNETARAERNHEVNRTILSGDIDHTDPAGVDAANPAEFASDLRGMNAFHVVVGSLLDSSAVLDGFIITAGSASDSEDYPKTQIGGGLFFMTGSKPTLANLRITGNYAAETGGGIYNEESSPKLTNVTISGNEAYHGAGMANENHSNAVLKNVLFQANEGIEGPGMYNTASSPKLANVRFHEHTTGYYGGAMYNNGAQPFFEDVRFINNTAELGGAIYNTNVSYVTVTNTTFQGNSAAKGGAIYNDDGSDAIITTSRFSDNQGRFGASCITNTGNSDLEIKSSTISGNTGESTIENRQQFTVSILTDVTFQNNTGPVINEAGSSIHHIRVMYRNNTGGALSNKGYATFVDSALIGNSNPPAGYGGAILHQPTAGSGMLTLKNVTISGNQAANGGGIAVLGGSAELNYVTFQENHATSQGKAIYADSGSTVGLSNSIVWGSGVDNQITPVGDGTKVTAVYSDILMKPHEVYPGEGNISAPPRLGQPGDYGGDTWVTPLLPGSAAIDQARCAHDIRTDQRGIDRGFDTACDMGAYEAREFTFRAVSGGGQSAEVGQLFGSPLIVEVTSSYGDPVDGTFVSFYAPQNGASAMITQLPATVVGGTAQVSARANNQVGAYEVTARIPGLAPVTFQLTNAGEQIFLPLLQMP